MKKVLMFLLVLVIFGCKGEKMSKTEINDNEFNVLLQKNLVVLSSKKIYFGHQSVGFNIIEGVKDVVQQYSGIKIDIKETKNPQDFNEDVFAHSRIGKNKEPKSKIEDFRKVMESGIGEKVDLAFFKFCFVDVDEKTNVDGLFKDYVNIITALEAKYPKVRIVHFTVPLTTIEIGLKAKIKILSGKLSTCREDNIKRGIFNHMLISKYGNNVFDLAGIESTYPQGGRNVFLKNDESFEYLIPKFSDDGGHLNDLGRKLVAKKLISFLADN